MEVYLEVDEDNVGDLREVGLDVELGDELTCKAIYDVNPEDPDVGIMSSSCDVYAVEYDGENVTPFFDLNTLCEQAEEYEVDEFEDAECEAAEARWEQMREERYV